VEFILLSSASGKALEKGYNCQFYKEKYYRTYLPMSMMLLVRRAIDSDGSSNKSNSADGDGMSSISAASLVSASSAFFCLSVEQRFCLSVPF